MAAGDTLLTFHPLANSPPSSNPATYDRRNGHVVLDFDDTTAEAAIFSDVLPQNYAGNGITVYVHWSTTSAVTGSVGWTIEFERIGAAQQNIDSDGFASAQTIIATTVPGTSGHVAITSVAVSNGANMDSIAVGELFRLRIKRNVASDNAAGDAELHAIELRETN